MSCSFKIFVVLGLLFTSINISGQSYITQQKRELLKKRIKSLPISPAKLKAVNFARQRNLPIRKKFPDGRIIEIAEITEQGFPIYYTTNNLTAAKTVSTFNLWPMEGFGYALEGENMSVGIWDGGSVLFDHVELEWRVNLMNDAETTDHSTHVGGTIAASGINTYAHGMAPKAIIESYDWSNVESEMELAAENGLLVANHSWGIIQGWYHNSEDDRWEWYGNPSISDTEDFKFGIYGTTSQQWDQLANQYPFFLIVKAAGNDRGEGPDDGETHYVYDGQNWTPSTAIRLKDGGSSGYDCIDMTSTGKNILTVGAVRDISTGYQSPWNVTMSSFSGWGPTDDGRIKPDIVANGIELFSSTANTRNSYNTFSGTSMATPSVSGSLILLQELYFKRFGAFMRSATLKGLVIHTADEAGSFEGPDYQFGWGLLNTFKAAELIDESRVNYPIFEEVLNNEEIYSFPIKTTENIPLCVTLSWTDPAGEPQQTILDPSGSVLINDLDLRIIRTAGNIEYQPYILDKDNPAAAAGQGDNSIDNVEQVYIASPGTDEFIIQVSHKGTLLSPQGFSLIVSGGKSECLCAKDDDYTLETGSIIPTCGGLDYAPNSDCEWEINPGSGNPVYLSFTRFEIEDENDYVEIYDQAPETGNLLGRYTGTMIPATTVSNTGRMVVKFHSDNQTNGKWEAIYYTTPPEIIASLDGKQAPCLESRETYSIKANGALAYEWELPDGWNGTPDSDSILVIVGETSGTIRVRAINDLGISDYSELPVTTVHSGPASISFQSFDPKPCLGSSTIYEVTNLENTWYNWEFPDDWSSTGTASTINVQVGQLDGTIQVTPENQCGTGTSIELNAVVASIPEKPEEIFGPDTVCENSPEIYSIPPVEEIDYVWTIPGTWTFTGKTTDSLAVLSGIQEGLITAAYVNKCGISDTIVKMISIDPLPEKPEVSETDGWLAGPEAFRYIWTFNGDTLNETGKTIYPVHNGSYSLSVTNQTGCPVQSDAIIIDRSEKELLVFPSASRGNFTFINDTDISMILSVTTQTGVEMIRLKELQPGEHNLNIPNKGIFSVVGIYTNKNGKEQKRIKRIIVY